MLRLLFLLVPLATSLSAAAPDPSLPRLFATQGEDGSWHGSVTATAYGLLALVGRSGHEESAVRAAAWLAQQPPGQDLAAETLLLWSLGELLARQPQRDTTCEARLRTGLQALTPQRCLHRGTTLRLGLPAQSKGAVADTVTTVCALAAGQLGGQGDVVGGGDWFAAAWSAGNMASLAEVAVPGEFPLALDTGGIKPVTVPGQERGAAAWGLIAAILLDHHATDLPRRRLRQALASRDVLALNDASPLTHWWSLLLAWRLHFNAESSRGTLTALRLRLLDRTVTDAELPCWCWSLRLADSGETVTGLSSILHHAAAERSPPPGQALPPEPAEVAPPIDAADLQRHLKQLLVPLEP